MVTQPYKTAPGNLCLKNQSGQPYIPIVNFYICCWKEIHPCNTLLPLGVLYGTPTLKKQLRATLTLKTIIPILLLCDLT